MNSKFLLASAVSMLMIIGCASNDNAKPVDSKDSAAPPASGPVDTVAIKVFVSKDGKVTADGNLVSLVDLDSSFSQLKQKNGVVYYSREVIQGEPPESSMKVIELVVKYSLPIRMYTDSTFTKIFTPN